MPKVRELRESLSSIDFPSILIDAIKNNKDYKVPCTFCFQNEDGKIVYVSFFNTGKKVYAITETEGTPSRLYKVTLSGARVNFTFLTGCNDNTMHPTIGTLISGKSRFKMQEIANS